MHTNSVDAATPGYIYNITTQVTWRIHDLWLEWMKTIHVPAIMATGCFVQYQFVRLLDIDETDGPTYAAQFYAISKADCNRYTELYDTSLRLEATANWGSDFMGFRSLMQVVN